MRRLAPALALAVVACAGARFERSEGPAVSLPARIAEGTPQDEDGGVTEQPDARPWPRNVGRPPDPEALREARQWEYEVTYDAGTVRITKVTPKLFPKPIVTRRDMGRWAIELWIGRELIERVRFDFPLLRAEEPRKDRRRPLHEPPSFAAGAVMSQTLLVPASPRATRALLVDRATGEETELPWPPDAPLPPARAQLPRKSPPDAAIDAGPAADAGAAEP